MITTEKLEVPSEPGIYEGLSFETYLQIDAVNNSSLKPLERSPAHYKIALAQESNTDAQRFGQFLHDSTLDPETVGKYYAVEPDLTQPPILRKDGTEYDSPRSTKEYKKRKEQFLVLAGEKRIVSHQWYQSTQIMLQRLHRNERARTWLTAKGPAEVTVVFDEPTTGIRCKARLDKWCPDLGIIADLKTTADICDFNWSVGKFGYHRQAAFYIDAVQSATGEPHRFGFVAIEKGQPFCVRSALLCESSVNAGRDEYRSSLQKLAECRERNEWPGPDEPEEWRCPERWLANSEDVAITINGLEV